MSFRDLVSMALKNLKNRKLRTFLTIIGVVIGATSIIVMLSIGFGYKRINKEMYNSLGDLTTLEVRDGPGYDETMIESQGPNSKKKKLNDIAVEEIKKVEHVKSVMPIYSGSASLKSGKYTNEWVSIVATNPSVMEEFGYKLSEGRYLTGGDKSSGVVLSFNASKNFMDPKRAMVDVSNKVKPMDSKIDIYNISKESSSGVESDINGETEENQKVYSERLKVVGLLEEDPNNWEEQNIMLMSIDYFKNLIKSSNEISKKKTTFEDYNLIKVKIDNFENTKEVQKNLKEIGYNATNMYANFLEQENKNLSVIQIVFGAIGSIAFIVAAIGITNTMVMSIYERTKEIGVMKVIGAEVKDIQKLFLIESGFIGFFGGVIGIIVSYILSLIANYFAKNFVANLFGNMATDTNISYIPIWLAILALIFSTAIGVISGYLPARRAMNLSVLDAIRTE